MFNSIYVKCPKCEERVEFQTKSGSTMLDSWNLEDAPNREVEGIIGDMNMCKCGHRVLVEHDIEPEIKIKLKIS